MAFRALLFSNNTETNTALTNVCTSAGIRLELYRDIFCAIEKATKRSFSAVLADWANQPETGFLLRRARESSPNRNLVVIAIVDHDPTAVEARDHRLDFLIHRPIVAAEAQEVLAKAAERMQSVAAGTVVKTIAAERANDDSSMTAEVPEQPRDLHRADEIQPNVFDPQELPVAENAGDGESTSGEVEEEPVVARHHAFPFGQVFATVLLLIALFCLWSARDPIVYLAQTREGRIKVLTEAMAALLYLNPAGSVPARSVGSDVRQDAYFNRSAGASDSQSTQISVVTTAGEPADSQMPLRKPADFTLPTPVYEPPARDLMHTQRGTVPDSLRSSAPIARPVIVTPAQMMPVSMPAVPPPPPQFSEPVPLSEDAARALLVQSVNPTYPPEATAQKLRGPVVLQVTIGRDGSVEDLKIVRGPFVLAKAAIAAVKRWQFRPYTVDGRAAQTQTVLTINF